MARVLITGGTGFIGSHAVEAFLASGWTVRALVRNPDRLRWLAGLPVELAQGGVDEPADLLKKALTDCDVVVHCAGLTKARHDSDYFRVNADATRNLVCASREAGVGRFVLCSSQAAAGPVAEGRAVVETDTPQPVSAYGRSKLAGEKALCEAADGVSWIVLRPPTVIGPRDEQLRPLFRAVVRFGVYPEIGGGNLHYSFVGVHDLAQALLLAAEINHGLNETYFVANSDHLTWREAALTIAGFAGKRVRPLHFNRTTCMMLSTIAEASAAVTGIPALLSRDKMREILTPGWICSAEKIRTTWNFECKQSLEETLRITYDAYGDAHWL